MATFSPCKNYRYKLWRTPTNAEQKSNILFIMLNPSTASDDKDDKTIKILYEITNKWNCGNIYVGNIYPYCASKPSLLNNITIPNEIIETNINYVKEMVDICDIIIYAWGTKGPLGDKQLEPEWLKDIVKKNVYCISKSVKGVPKHPCQWGDWRKSIPDKPILFR